MAQQGKKQQSGPESGPAPASGQAPSSQALSSQDPSSQDPSSQDKGLVAEPNRWLMNLNLSYEDMLRSAVDWLWETNAQLTFTQVSTLHDDIRLSAPLQTGSGLVDVLDLAQEADDEPLMVDLLDAREAFRGTTVLISEPQGKPKSEPGDELGDEPAAAPDAGAGTASPAEQRLYRLSGVPLYDRRNGQFLGYRGTGVVVGKAEATAQRSARPDNRLLSLLEQALSRKDQLEWELSKAGHKTFEARLESIAHELRTPLNAIIGFAEIIKTRALGNDLERYVNYGNDIYDSGVHMVALVNNLIDLARIDSRQDPLQHELLDAREVVASALRMLEEQAANKGIKLVNHLNQELPALRSERQALRQIFLNLLSNGIKYTRSGGAVGVESEISREGIVSIVVWDTGIGIPLEEQEKVFQRTYRVQGAANAGKPGSGLGLAISRDLARAMGGDITVLSRPGQGARFTVRLPAAGDSSGA